MFSFHDRYSIVNDVVLNDSPVYPPYVKDSKSILVVILLSFSEEKASDYIFIMFSGLFRWLFFFYF